LASILKSAVETVAERKTTTITEAEIAHVVVNPDFFKKAKFYLNGAEVKVRRDRVFELLK